MKMRLLILVAVLASCIVTACADIAPPLDAFAQNRRLGKGLNVSLKTDLANLRLIKNAGFQSVRLPLRWDKNAAADVPYTIDQKYFLQVDQFLANAQQLDLNVVLDFHGCEGLTKEPDANKARYMGIWKQVAERYKNQPDGVFYELLNEPNGNLEKQYNELMAQTIAAIREVDPRHTLIVGGVWWSHVKALAKLVLPKNEKNVIATFHYYDPMVFTHQGAEWSSKYQTTGVVWPGPPPQPVVPVKGEESDFWEKYNTLPTAENPANPQRIIDAMDFAQTWSKQHNVPLWLGEFGAYRRADMDSRIRWTQCVREAAEKRGISWAYWEFDAGFGVYDRSATAWREGLLQALIAPAG